MKKLFALATLAAAAAIAATPSVAQNIAADPTFGTYNLAGGFQPDPVRVRVISGGTINAERLGNGCSGFIADAPDVRLNYKAGSLPLILSVASDADTTLVINRPDGTWWCDDDSGNKGLNPSVVFQNATDGQYDIWIGTFASTDTKNATLVFSELYSE